MDVIMALSGMAILVIDVQRYYTELTSPLVTFTETLYPGGTDYIQRRLDTVVIPNITQILTAARNSDVPIIYADYYYMEAMIRAGKFPKKIK
jgi:nicotinamidase-related amidase